MNPRAEIIQSDVAKTQQCRMSSSKIHNNSTQTTGIKSWKKYRTEDINR